MPSAPTYADIVLNWIEAHPDEHEKIQQYGVIRFKLNKEYDESDEQYRDRLVTHIRGTIS